MGGLIGVERKVKPEVRVFPDVNELSLRVAEAVARTVNAAVRSTGRCFLVLIWWVDREAAAQQVQPLI